MSISKVLIKDFLVFSNEFEADFCSGINVIIGGNGTGKTSLLKVMYRLCGRGNTQYSRTEDYFFAAGQSGGAFGDKPFEYLKMQIGTDSKSEIYGDLQDEIVFTSKNYKSPVSVFIPVDNMMSHSKGIVEMMDKYELDFDVTQIDILRNAQRPATRKPEPNCVKVIDKLSNIIGGEVIFDNGRFYIKKNNGRKIEFAVEASGFVRLGLLWKLLRNGLLESGSILFWDEPESSINPENMDVITDILLELSRNGVQIFIATHSEILASYFAVNRKPTDNVQFTSLYKTDEQVKATTSDRFDLLEPNNLTSEPIKLYEKEIEKGLGGK